MYAEASRPATGRVSNTALSIFANDWKNVAMERAKTGSVAKSIEHNTNIQDLACLRLGFDWIDFSYNLSGERLGELLEYLDEQFAEFQQNEEATITVGSLDVIPRRSAGFFAYNLHFDHGVVFRIPRSERFPVQIHFGSDYCALNDNSTLDWAASALLACLLGLDADRKLDLSIARVDVALDIKMQEQAYQKLVTRLARRDGVVSRVRSSASYKAGDDYTGVTFGAGSSLQLRVYDKFEEAKNPAKWEDVFGIKLADLRASGEMVARFEYQIRGEFLRTFALDDGRVIRTFEDLQEVWRGLMFYLTVSWFRMAGRERGHENRRKTLIFWQSVSVAFVCLPLWAGASKSTGQRNLARYVSGNPEALAKQVVGCLASLAGRLGASNELGSALTLDEVWGFVSLAIDREEFERVSHERLYCALYDVPIKGKAFKVHEIA